MAAAARIVVDNSHMPIGKAPAKLAGQPMLAKYLADAPITFPANYNEAGPKRIAWGALLNDELGDCTIAGVAHKLQADTAIARVLWSATDDQVLKAYENWDGYKPGFPFTDKGGVEADVLAKWYRDGFFGHSLVAYGAVDCKDHDAVRHFCAELNGLYIGVLLPNTAKRQAVWDVVNTASDDAQPGSWGGHCVYVYGYTSDAKGRLKTVKFVSWGKEMEMTAAFWAKYVDEAWGVLTAALIKNGRTPANLNVAALKTEIDALPKAA